MAMTNFATLRAHISYQIGQLMNALLIDVQNFLQKKLVKHSELVIPDYQLSDYVPGTD